MNPNKTCTGRCGRQPLSGFGRWLAVVPVAIWLALASPAWAQDCRPFLDVLGSDRQSTVLSLDSCEVSAAEPWAESATSRVWRLAPAAQQRWDAVLTGDSLAPDLLDARLRARPRGQTMQSGPLLNRVSARLVKPASWRWDARRGEIALMEVDPAAVSVCLDASPLLFWFGTQDIAQGGNRTAQVLVARGPGRLQAVPASCIDAWRTEPTPFATVDQQGLVRISDSAPDGTLVTLTALVGPREVQGRLRVLDPQRYPLMGTWSQVGETPCASGIARPPADPVREFKLDGSGNFSVTTTPFEAYKDYWGRYELDLATGALRLAIESGNKIPPGLKLSGRVGGGREQLELHDLSLWPPKDGVAICAMQFVLHRR